MRFIGERRAAKSLYKFRKLTREEFISQSGRFLQLKKEFIEFWRKEGLDAVISPVLPVPCISHNTAGEYPSFNQFNFLCNMVDLPSCTVPLYLNTDCGFDPNPVFNDRVTQLFNNEVKESVGMPVGVQVFALPMQDERVLTLVEEISGCYDYDVKCRNKILETLNK